MEFELLRKGEKQVMDIFWSTGRQLTSLDLHATMQDAMSIAHLHRTLQSLKQKGYIAVCGLEEPVTHPTRKFETRIGKTEYVARLVESQGLCDSALAQIGLSFLRKPKKGQSEEDRQKLIAELEAMLEEYKNGDDD